jgi:hypothetical protein
LPAGGSKPCEARPGPRLRSGTGQRGLPHTRRSGPNTGSGGASCTARACRKKRRDPVRPAPGPPGAPSSPRGKAARAIPRPQYAVPPEAQAINTAGASKYGSGSTRPHCNGRSPRPRGPPEPAGARGRPDHLPRRSRPRADRPETGRGRPRPAGEQLLSGAHGGQELPAHAPTRPASTADNRVRKPRPQRHGAAPAGVRYH